MSEAWRAQPGGWLLPNDPIALAWQYPYTTDEAHALLANHLPLVSREEFDAWADAGTIDCAETPQGRRFARSFLGNIVRRRPKLLANAQDLRIHQPTWPTKSPDGEPVYGIFDLDAHLESLMWAQETDRPWIGTPQRFVVRHEIEVKPGAVPVGTLLRVWIPMPKPSPATSLVERVQDGVEMLETWPADTSWTSSKRSVHDTVCATTTMRDDGVRIGVRYAVTLRPSWRCYANDPPTAADLDLGDAHLAMSETGLEERREGAPMDRLIGVVQWIQQNFTYIAALEYRLIPHMARHAFASREGDCGLWTMAFLRAARAAGIPARWRSGWFLKPRGGTMHDWAEANIEPWGWLPVDPTYGLRVLNAPPAMHAHAPWWYVGGNDGLHLTTNTGFAGQFDPPMQYRRADPIDSQRGEVQAPDRALYYGEWTHRVSWQ